MAASSTRRAPPCSAWARRASSACSATARAAPRLSVWSIPTDRAPLGDSPGEYRGPGECAGGGAEVREPVGGLRDRHLPAGARLAPDGDGSAVEAGAAPAVDRRGGPVADRAGGVEVARAAGERDRI